MLIRWHNTLKYSIKMTFLIESLKFSQLIHNLYWNIHGKTIAGKKNTGVSKLFGIPSTVKINILFDYFSFQF